MTSDVGNLPFVRSSFRFQATGCMRRVQGVGCRVEGAGCRVEGAGCRVLGAGFWVQGLDSSLGFRV
jgi:hypothetical protein